MSVLPPEIHSALGSLLQGLQSPDNNVRAHAEEQLNNEWIVARADVLLMGLVEQIQGAPEAGVPIASFDLATTTNELHTSLDRLQPSFSVALLPRLAKSPDRRSRKTCSSHYNHRTRRPYGRNCSNVYRTRVCRMSDTRSAMLLPKLPDNTLTRVSAIDAAFRPGG